MPVSDTYTEYSALWEFVPQGEPRTVANQLAAAAQSLVTNWLNNGGTIWDMQTNPYSEHPCQSCADWLYQYADGADTVIDTMNRQSFAGRPEFLIEVDDLDDEDDEYWAEQLGGYGLDINEVNVDAEKADMEEYDQGLDSLLFQLNDYNALRALDKIPAVDSIDNCKGPVYDVATSYASYNG